MRQITTIEYNGNIATKGYKKSRIRKISDMITALHKCTPKFFDDLNQLLDDLKWSNFDGFIIHPRMKLVEIYSNPKAEPNPQIIDEQIIKDNPNFDYMGSGDKDIFGK